MHTDAMRRTEATPTQGNGPDAHRPDGTRANRPDLTGDDPGAGYRGTEDASRAQADPGRTSRDDAGRRPPSREEIRQALRSGLDPRDPGRRRRPGEPLPRDPGSRDPGLRESGLRDLGFGDPSVQDADGSDRALGAETRGVRGDRLVLPPTTDESTTASRPNSFPSERELLKRPPFWQRTLRRLPVSVPGEGQLRKAPSVRDRERHRALLRLVALVVVIVLVGGGLWLASTRDKSSTTAIGGATTIPAPTLVRVKPTGVSASTESGSRIAAKVIDNSLGTFWSRLVPSQDNQPSLRFTFSHAVDLGRLTIAAGASGSEFSKRPRPQEIELRFSDGSTLRTTLADQPAFQTVSFSPRKVNVVRLVILSTYPSSGPQRTSISEIRFLAVKS
jgi:hypothetical protein